MRNQIIDDNNSNPAYTQATLSKTFMSNVFSYMFGALAISGLAAYIFGTSDLIELLYNTTTGSTTILGWIVMFSPIGLILFMGARMQKLSFPSMLSMFVLYSIITGVSLSFVFLAYTSSSLVVTFLVTSGTFGVMAIVGYTTSTDLTKFGSILRMALIGLIISMFANYFFVDNAGAFDYIISGLGVLIFTGLTAYDTQKLKREALKYDTNSAEGKKRAIWGALSLYLDFLNLFLFLLRFMGGRD